MANPLYDVDNNSTSVSKARNDCKLGSEDHYTIGCYVKLRETIKANGGGIGGVIIIFVVAQVYNFDFLELKTPARLMT